MSFISRHRGSKAACGGGTRQGSMRQVWSLGSEQTAGMPLIQVPAASFSPLPPSPSLPTTGAGCRCSSGCLVQLAHHGCWLQVLFSAQCTVQLKGRLTLRSSAAFFSSSVSSSSRPSLVHEASFLPSYSLSCRQPGRKARQPNATQKPARGGRAKLAGRLERAGRRASRKLTLPTAFSPTPMRTPPRQKHTQVYQTTTPRLINQAACLLHHVLVDGLGHEQHLVPLLLQLLQEGGVLNRLARLACGQIVRQTEGGKRQGLKVEAWRGVARAQAGHACEAARAVLPMVRECAKRGIRFGCLAGPHSRG